MSVMAFMNMLKEKDAIIKSKDELIRTILLEKDAALKDKDEIIRSLTNKITEMGQTLISNSGNTYNNTIQNNGVAITTAQIKSLLPEYSMGDPIEKITDMSQIFDENADNFLLDITYDYRQNILHESIGNSIVDTYKKDNPKQQSIWTTDTSRQNYILLLENAIGKQKVEWVTDKKGVHVKSRIIDPILAYLKAKLEDYIPSKTSKSLEAKGVMMSIVKEINDGILARKINRYISTHFHMTENVRKAITYEKPKKKPRKQPKKGAKRVIE